MVKDQKILCHRRSLEGCQHISSSIPGSPICPHVPISPPIRIGPEFLLCGEPIAHLGSQDMWQHTSSVPTEVGGAEPLLLRSTILGIIKRLELTLFSEVKGIGFKSSCFGRERRMRRTRIGSMTTSKSTSQRLSVRGRRWTPTSMGGWLSSVGLRHRNGEGGTGGSPRWKIPRKWSQGAARRGGIYWERRGTERRERQGMMVDQW